MAGRPPAAAIVRGWVYKHKRGAKSSKFQRRYAVYELESGVFTYYTDDSMSVPKGRTHVMYAIRRLAPKNRCEGQKLVEFEGEMVEARMYEFTIRTEDSKFFDVAVESLEKRDEWVDGMPKPPSFAISGWLNQPAASSARRKLFSTGAPRARRRRRAPRVHLLRLPHRGVGAARGRAG